MTTMNNPAISSKRKFSILNKLLRKNKSSTIPPLIENGETVTDPKCKSDLLNNHCADKATVDGSSHTPPNLLKTDVLSSLNQINTSPLEVGKIIHDCKKSHQSYCGVPGKFLSIISTTISFPLSIMFNPTFENRFSPDTFKLAHITCIWKQKGPKLSKLFHRPISLLQTVSKIIESMIHNTLLSPFMEN